MAGGNLGDLSFSLTLQSRVEQEAKKLIQALNNVDATGKKAQEALDAITTAATGMGSKGQSGIGKLNKIVRDLGEGIAKLKEQDAVDKKQLSDLDKVLDGYLRILGVIREIRSVGGMTTNVDVGAARVEEILQQRRHTREQEAKKEAEIENARQEKIRQSAQIAQEAYSQEIAASREKAASFAADIKRQMEEEMKLRQYWSTAPKVQIQSRIREQFANEMRENPLMPILNKDGIKDIQRVYQQAIDEIQKKIDELQGKIANFHGPSDNEWLLRTKAEIGDLEAKVQGLLNLSKQAGSQFGQTYKPYTGQTASDEAAMARRRSETKAAYEEYFAQEEKLRRERQQTQKEQDAAADRARANVDKVQRRYEQLFDILQKLRSTRDDARAIGLDTAKIDAQIQGVIRSLESLRSWRNNALAHLNNGSDMRHYVIGNKDFSVDRSMGSGVSARDLELLNRQITAQQQINKEKQASIESEKRHQAEVAATAAKVRSDLVNAFEQANKSASGMKGTLQDIKSLFLQGGIVYGAKQFFDAVVQTGGEIEKQHIALRSIIGDRAKADELFQQTQQLALQSPFKFGELNRDVKQLAAFGVEANDLYETTKRLADISSGLGVDFSRLGLAYGQVKARSWLDGKELRQFAYAGLPLLKSLTDLYNQTGKGGRSDYTEGDVKKMISNREVSFEDVQKVLWSMTDEGGKFYNMQFVLSETLLGKWNKLIDAWEIMLSKFADGKSIIGGVFKTAITGATNLVLAMDKLSPALIAFGAMFAMKKGWGALTAKTGLGAVGTQMKAAQATALRTYAIEQQQAVIEGKITAEKMRQNIADRQGLINSQINRRNAMETLALQGKLSLLQMQRAFREKLISPELVKQLQTLNLISAKESELIMKSGMWSRGMLAARQAWNGISGFFTTGNLVMMGLTAAFAIWQKIDADQEKVKQRAKDISDSAREHAQAMADALKNNGSVDTSDPQKLQQTNDALKGVLEQSGYYTDTIKEQVEEAGTLIEQYKILKKAVEDAKNSSDTEDKYSGVISNAIAGSGNWFNNDITENAQEAEEWYNKLSLEIDGFDAKTREAMNNVADSMLGPKASAMTLEEKIIALKEQGGDAYEQFTRKVSNGNRTMATKIYYLGHKADLVVGRFKEIANDDIPKIIKKISGSLGLSENEFRKWASKNVTTFDTMFTKILNLCNLKVPGIVKKLREIMYESLKLQDPQKPKDNANKPKTWKNPLKAGSVGRKAFDKLYNAGKLNGGKGGFYQKEMAELINTIGNNSGNSWHDFGESLQNIYKTVRNENNSAKKAGEKQPYYHKQKMLEAIANQTGVSLDVGKDRVTGDFGKNKGGEKKEDKELKERQERLNSLKSARQEYQKYQTTMTDEAAALKIQKLFPEVKDLDLNKYEESVKKIFENFNFEKSPERRKFRTSLYRELADWAFSEVDKKQFDKEASDFKESLDRISDRWDLYKDLLEKTGDDNFANLAFYDRYYLDDKVKNLMTDYKNKYKKIFGLQEVMSMTDGDAKEKLRGPGEYEAWKKIVTLLRGNYIEALRRGADITKETLSYDEQAIAVQERYNKLIKEQTDLGNTRAARAYEIQRDKEISTINYKRITNSVDYARFFATTIIQSNKQLRKYSNTLKNELSKALKDGAITAEEYSNKVNEINKRMSDIDSGATLFIGSGLNGVSNGIKQIGEKKQQEGNSIYNAAQEAYNKAKAINDVSKMADAQKNMDAGKAMSDGGAELMKGADEMGGSISMIDKIIHGINDLVQGFNDTFQDIKETAQALGQDTNTDDWNDMNTFFTSFSNASDSATKGWDSLKEGNIGGVISGVVGSWTGWIKGFAQGHDQKLDNQIKIAEQQLTLLQNISDNVSKVIQNTLGGIYTYKMSDYTQKNLSQVASDYEKRKELEAQLGGTESTSSSTAKGLGKGLAIGGAAGGLVGAAVGGIIGGLSGLFGSKKKKLRSKINALPNYSEDTYNQAKKAQMTGEAYDAQLASLMAQKDQLQKQRDSETSKKNKDKSKIADYDKKIEDARLEIQNFTQTWLKDIYGVDLKDWASQLTDALVDAWSKGEDAADAYHDTVQDLMKDLTKKVISQSILEARMQPVLDMYTDMLTKNSGKINKEDLTVIWQKLLDQEQGAIDDTYSFLEYAKKQGLDLSENGSLSTTNSIKSITEETADLLASYINSIRLDVSVNRENVRLIALAVKNLPNLNVVAEEQLLRLNSLVGLAEARNEKLDMMYEWMRATTNGTKKISVA